MHDHTKPKRTEVELQYIRKQKENENSVEFRKKKKNEAKRKKKKMRIDKWLLNKNNEILPEIIKRRRENLAVHTNWVSEG